MGARLERYPRARAPRTRSTARRTRASRQSRSRRARSIASRARGRVASARWDGDGFWIGTVGTSRRRRRSGGCTGSTILKVKICTKSMTDPSYRVSSYHVFMYSCIHVFMYSRRVPFRHAVASACFTGEKLCEISGIVARTCFRACPACARQGPPGPTLTHRAFASWYECPGTRALPLKYPRRGTRRIL